MSARGKYCVTLFLFCFLFVCTRTHISQRRRRRRRRRRRVVVVVVVVDDVVVVVCFC